VTRSTVVLLLTGVLAIGGCGKRGNPLPPLRPLPAAIADLTARRVDTRVELSFTIPAANVDGTTPVAIDRVEVHAVPVMPGVTPKTVAQIIADTTTLRTTIAVRPPASAADARPPAEGGAPPVNPAATTPVLPAPGERTSLVDDVGSPVPGATAINYVAVGVVGGGRGRKGPASPMVSVSLADPPAPPTALTLSHDERTITVTWPQVTGQQVLLFDATPTRPETGGAPIAPAPGPAPASAAASAATGPRQLTPSPVTTFSFSEPVTFAVERCYLARSVRVAGAASIQGPASPVACITPVDHYPPPAPASLSAIQEGQAITLIWPGVEASDLAGYVVLRGDGAGEIMRPLVRRPITDTTFSDTQVVPGATYTYTVYAVDTAPVPNVSQQSPRESRTVR
jgi:hypothetical protein